MARTMCGRCALDDATVLANGEQGPLVAVKSYGNGHFIYHAAMQPLIALGGYGPGMYSYLIFRNAIEWAFEAANLPIVKLSPWQYQYDAALMVRHDVENTPYRIQTIQASARFEQSQGAKGEYYLTTGTIRAGSPDTQFSEQEKADMVASIQRAVSQYGATIGSHNGGLSNPVAAVPPNDYDYWHWGPDEALDTAPAGYANGRTYATASLLTSFQDLEGWLAGLDNGRSGCGTAGNCPRTWVSPYFNSTREASNEILDELGAITVGEQKISPFPHWTLSTQTSGKRFNSLTLPVSDWFVDTDIAQSQEAHTVASLHAAIDFYYNLGALINVYGHEPSDSNPITREYVTYGMAKPNLWTTNSVGIRDWWTSRSGVMVTPSYTQVGNAATASATISGATDPQTAIELVIPNWDPTMISRIEVFRNGQLVDSSDYRVTGYGLKIRAGVGSSIVEIRKSGLTAVTMSSLTATAVARPSGPWLAALLVIGALLIGVAPKRHKSRPKLIAR